VNDEKYELNIKNSFIKQEYPEPSIKFWNPRLYLGYDFGANLSNLGISTGPSLNLQIMSYGKYNNSPDFSFFQLGLGVDIQQKVFTGVLSPFSYNIGSKIPFMSNLYVGPSIAFGMERSIMVMGGIRVGL